jgi:hypothetical protein
MASLAILNKGCLETRCFVEITSGRDSHSVYICFTLLILRNRAQQLIRSLTEREKYETSIVGHIRRLREVLSVTSS